MLDDFVSESVNKAQFGVFLRNMGPNHSVRNYLCHVEQGVSIRALAKRTGVHPSTISRRVRKIEAKREDPLVDDVLRKVSRHYFNRDVESRALMTKQMDTKAKDTPVNLDKDAMRILRRLCEHDAFLIMSVELDKAVVMRGAGAKQIRSAVLSRELGQSLLLQDWVERVGGGKFSKYALTQAGRAALKRMVALQAKLSQNQGFNEAVTPFQEQHIEWGTRSVADGGKSRKLRVNLRESPVTMLARKKDKNGKPFLSHDLLQAGERLREDFELSQIGPRVSQNWDRFLIASDRGSFGSSEGGGSSAAHTRLQKAFDALGPDLADIALRCCCFLEGLEAAEKRLGWSARSGKIVLRIALQRLRWHYEKAYGGMSQKIG